MPDPAGGVVATVTLPYREDGGSAAGELAVDADSMFPLSTDGPGRAREVKDESAGARR